MKARRLLVIGAGHEQVPALQVARRLGLRVVATDRNPQAPGARLADHFEAVSTADAAGNLAVARRHAVHGVMTVGSETAVPVVARIAREMGLAGLSEDCAAKATHKIAMREAFAAHGVPGPPFREVASLAQAQAFWAEHGGPVVLKPAIGSGQRGVTLVQTEGGLVAALAEAQGAAADGRALIESWCPGPEINVTAVVQGGRCDIMSLSQRITAAPPHFGIALEHLAPPPLADDALQQVRQAAQQAVAAVGLRDGIAYPQIISTPQGAKLVEIAARIPGGHMREVAWHLAGIDLVEAAIRIALGQSDVLQRCQRAAVASALSVRFITALDFPGHALQPVAALQGQAQAQAVPGVQLVRMHLAPGQRLPALDSSAARFGAVLATGDDAAQAQARSEAAARLLRIEWAQEPQHA